MDDPDHHWRPWIWRVSAVLAVLATYPLSLGPVWLAFYEGWIPAEFGGWLIFGPYWPLMDFATNSDGGFVSEIYLEYIDWWRS